MQDAVPAVCTPERQAAAWAHPTSQTQIDAVATLAESDSLHDRNEMFELDFEEGGGECETDRYCD